MAAVLRTRQRGRIQSIGLLKRQWTGLDNPNLSTGNGFAYQNVKSIVACIAENIRRVVQFLTTQFKEAIAQIKGPRVRARRRTDSPPSGPSPALPKQPPTLVSHPVTHNQGRLRCQSLQSLNNRGHRTIRNREAASFLAASLFWLSFANKTRSNSRTTRGGE